MKGKFLSRFTPSLMSPETLEAIFVQRHKLADRIVQLTRDSALTPSKHHTLLIGPRGIGKTHIVALIYYRIAAMEDLRDRLRIAWLREEEWGVTSFLDLLLRIFSALIEEYKDDDLAERLESLYNLPPDAAERTGATILKEYIGGGTLLLLVENLDDLFAGLGDIGQKQLRAYLQENPFCSILATSLSLFNGVSLQTSPFYGFFRIRHLEGLGLDDATRLLTQIADNEGDDELRTLLQTPMGRARIRAVHHLAGGSHRVYVIFSQFLTRESLDELVEPFLNMLDDLTPYYQARMAHLSPQQRKIVNFLCDRSSAMPVKEIAQRCFMTHQTASSQLKKLQEMGYVRSESVGRESYYELREPLMRMGIEVKKHRGQPIRLFVDFLRLWYSPDELRQRLTNLAPDATLDREYLRHALQAAQTEHAQDDTDELNTIFDRGNDLFDLGRYEEALETYDKLIKLDPNDVPAWNNRGAVLYYLERYDEALEAFDKAIELDPNDAQALKAHGKAVELNPNNAQAWNNRGVALGHLERYDEALEAHDKAIELGERSWYVFFDRAEALLALNRWNEGIGALDDVLSRFAHADELEASNTEAILRNLFTKSDAGTWRERAADLIALYDKHETLSALGQGLVRSIPTLNSPMVSDTATQMWRDIWQEAGKDHDELKIPLRLLDAAVRYREKKDRRILLRLPIEERKVLEQILEESDSSKK